MVKSEGNSLQEKMNIPRLQEMKRRGEKIAMVTVYDYPSALLADSAEIDVLLVGDSLGMVVLGHSNTLRVTMEDMIRHTRAVARAHPRALLVADMPFLSYQASRREAIRNAGSLLRAGAEGVKLEGGKPMARTVQSLVRAGIPVMGHIGLTPQFYLQLGGYKVQGRGREGEKIRADALALAEAGVFALVLECIPPELAAGITEEVPVPTIGIGAGSFCDGQVLVWHDLLGWRDSPPRFVKTYADLKGIILQALSRYRKEVKEGKFPGPEHVYR